ncbi:YhgE/Pip domain-containing protein [Herbiconiux ginsengi]|uniref:Putative membrane protein n=1 Tax=Herbiconiux ginsengi TaxID=381665 RepID=A0A1H3MAW1_9MICO|nr:YhgE/Pip family protein [Herbiconiux ginsengi]SDY73847.1 putative membrane protein [Herbiconiux ginsengi]
MSSLRSLVRRGDTGGLSPLARRVAIALAVLTPLLIAGVAVTSLRAEAEASSSAGGLASTGASAAAPSLPAAVVNLDQIVYLQDDGTVVAADPSTPNQAGTPVAAGKLLVSELTAGDSGQGFTWTVTDAGTASDGLTAGQYSAVVTIPKDFSAAYVSTAGSAPVQAQLQVQTNGANSYVTELLASALSANLQAALADKATQSFVTNTLSAFTALNTNLATAADGAGKLADGATTLAGYQGQLATGLAGAAQGGTDLDTAVQGLAVGMRAIADGTTDLPTYAQLLADGSTAVSKGVDITRGQFQDRANESQSLADRQSALAQSLKHIYDTMDPADPNREAIGTAAQDAGAIAVDQGLVTVALRVDYAGVDTLLAPGADLVSKGNAAFAEDLPLLTTTLSEVADGTEKLAGGTSSLAKGLGDLSSGAAGIATGSTDLATNMGALASGLDEAVAKIPTYTDQQQQTMATVVAQPIVTQQSDVDALPSSSAAIAAVAVPLALWVGAFAIYLLLAPFGRRELASTASTFRVVIGSLAPAALLGLLQAAIVAIVLFLVGAQPAHVAGSILFSVVMSLAFVMLHQGLVALFGQAGRLISLALVVVQIAAAAVIVPNGLSSPLYTGLSSLLPLSHAITGMQALIGGGSVALAAQEAALLVVFALIGLALTLIAVTRARSRSTVPVPAPSRASEQARTPSSAQPA